MAGEAVSEAERLVRSWSGNAARWTEAVRSGAIASRKLVTDRAIVDAVLGCAPRHVLDVGCGEGWLSRRLAGHGIATTGVDGSPELIAAAVAGGGSFRCVDYATIIAAPATVGGDYDLVVANFALLDDRAGALLQALAAVVAPGGALLIQTLHPFAAGPPYRDGWRTERFAGFGEAGWIEMPWYFRTIGSWLAALQPGWAPERIDEPLAPAGELPASLLITGRLVRTAGLEPALP